MYIVDLQIVVGAGMSSELFGPFLRHPNRRSCTVEALPGKGDDYGRSASLALAWLSMQEMRAVLPLVSLLTRHISVVLRSSPPAFFLPPSSPRIYRSESQYIVWPFLSLFSLSFCCQSGIVSNLEGVH